LHNKKWYGFEDVVVRFAKEGDLVLMYNMSTLDEVDLFEGSVVYDFEIELY
jgi:hypothetical protein